MPPDVVSSWRCLTFCLGLQRRVRPLQSRLPQSLSTSSAPPSRVPQSHWLDGLRVGILSHAGRPSAAKAHSPCFIHAFCLWVERLQTFKLKMSSKRVIRYRLEYEYKSRCYMRCCDSRTPRGTFIGTKIPPNKRPHVNHMGMKSNSNNRLESLITTEEWTPIIERYHSLTIPTSRSRNRR